MDAAQALSQHPVRHHRHDPDARGRRARPGSGAVLSPDRDGGPEPAPLAGHGTAPDASGPSPVRLALLEERAPAGSTAGLFAGIDTTLDALPRRERWQAIPPATTPAVGSPPGWTAPGRCCIQAGSAPSPRRSAAPSGTSIPSGDDGRAAPCCSARSNRTISAATSSAAGPGLGAGIDAVADDDRVLPAQPVAVDASLWNTGSDTLRVRRRCGPPRRCGTCRRELPPETTLLPGAIQRTTVTVVPDSAAPLTTPYFLRRPRAGSMYDWPGSRPR